jgi:hypothetical protein
MGQMPHLDVLEWRVEIDRKEENKRALVIGSKIVLIISAFGFRGFYLSKERK